MANVGHLVRSVGAKERISRGFISSLEAYSNECTLFELCTLGTRRVGCMKPKVAIVGYGAEGRSAYRYFAARGADITIFHKARPADMPEDVKVVEESHAHDLTGYDIVVRSPAVRPESLETDGRITTVTKEFFSVFTSQRIIGVTGSKGKGTISAIIYEMLKAAGKRVHLAGNIGAPVLELLPDIKDGDYVVLEL